MTGTNTGADAADRHADAREQLAELARRTVEAGPEHPAVVFGLIQLCLRFECMPAEAWSLVERMAEGDFSFDPEVAS